MNPNYKEINAQEEEKDKLSVLSYYKKLIQLRKRKDLEDAIVYGEFREAYSDKKNILAYYRIGEYHKILVLANYQEKEYQISLEDEIKEIVLSNYEEVEIKEGKVILKPYEVVVLQCL